ncbi:Fc.00g066740.m01.CDS01 [Cosmosporella sp. VM-42]
MKFSVAAVLAFAASAFAQTADFDPIFTPSNGEVVPAGSTFKITWQAPAKYANEKIIISLIGGATQATQVPLQDIATGVSNAAESYDWAVDASLGAEAFYGLVFKLQSDPNVFQYSMPFKIGGGSVSSSSASATTTLTATTGVKTVTLSSSSASTTVVVETTTSKPAPATTDIVIDVTTTVPCNGTTPIPVETKTAVTAITVPCNGTTLSTHPGYVTPTKGAPATPTGTEPAQVTAGAARIGAGSLAAVAGLVLAAFAL